MKVRGRDSAEYQVFGFGIEDINNQAANRMIGHGGCGGIAPSVAPAPTTPAPAAAPATWKTVVVGLQFLLVMNIALGKDCGVTAGLN